MAQKRRGRGPTRPERQVEAANAPPATGETAANTVRLCLDLNVWCANFLAERAGREGTASQTLVEIVRRGVCARGPVQLVISWGMLTRLRLVLEREWNVPATASESLISAMAAMAAIAAFGPANTPPYLTLGGTGVMPIRDEEDAHVIETAIAGRATHLVTANFADFVFPGTTVVVRDRVAEYRDARAELLIVHPYEMVARLTPPRARESRRDRGADPRR